MADQPTLKRGLGLPLLVLYGLGTTVGAGIFVLIGKVADMAGPAAPLSFLIAALLASLTALSFGEMASRFPVSAGQAAYVEAGLGSRRLATLVGFLVIIAGSVSSAAIIHGFVGYFAAFMDLPDWLAMPMIALILVTLACWGIVESVTVAALITVVEVGGLIIVAAAASDSLVRLPEIWTAVDSGGLSLAYPVLTAAVLAFYAFIGFEDMANLAEETRNVERNMRRAIIWTLVVTAVLYMTIATIAVLTVSPAELGASDAPLALIYERATGGDARLISAIGVIAVTNGALIQIIMASRVVYGLGSRGHLPALLATVHPRTRTPILATLIVGTFVLILAMLLPIVPLAQLTSLATLIIFTFVNLSLLQLRRRGVEQVPGQIPLWVPIAGFLVSGGFALFQVYVLVAG